MTEGLQNFKWTGINAQGKRVNGSLQASDINTAQVKLSKQGIEVINVVAKKGGFSFQFKTELTKKKIKQHDVLLFTRHLAAMLAAGLPIVQALEILAEDKDNPSMRSLISKVRNNITGGKTLAESLAEYPEQFNDLYCNLIKAGEKSGTLEKILVRLAIYQERSEMLKRKLKKALIYPVVIMCVALGVSLILLLFVVPQFENMFKNFGAELPAFTQMVVDMSDFLRDFWYIVLFGLVGFIAGLRYLLKTSRAAVEVKDKLILKIPVVGPILRKGIIARYSRTLATTMDAGMPIIESMNAMIPIMGNVVYIKAVKHICDELVSGNQLSTSMGATDLFPNMAVQMIAVGEASGSLSDMLNQVAEYYEEEVNDVVDNLSSLIEPLIMIVLGVVIGGFVVAMYLPIFRIGSMF